MKSECGEHQNNIAAYCLGDVDAEVRQALEAHFSACPQCRSVLEGYEKTIKQLASLEDEEIPRHFFVYPEKGTSSPWGLFRQMSLSWQSALATAAILLLCLGIAALSHLQIRSDAAGWALSFGGPRIGTAALIQEILAAAEIKHREYRAAWTNEIRHEISRSSDYVFERQQVQLKAALARMDSRFTAKIKNSEGQVKEDTRLLVSDMYRVISQQRARDLETTSLRLDSMEASSAVKTHQTNQILGTLLQVADLKLR